MPFSRSRSPVSMTRSPTISAWCAVKAPACRSIASTRVVFPWSTCATIATLRRFAVFTVSFRHKGQLYGSTASGTRIGGPDLAEGGRRSARAVYRGPMPRSRPTLGSSARSCSTSVRNPPPPGPRDHPCRRAAAASPVTGGVDAEGRIVVSTYPDRAKATNLRRDPRAPGSSSPTSGTTVGAGRRHRRGPRHARPGSRGRPGGDFRCISGAPHRDDYRAARRRQGKSLWGSPRSAAAVVTGGSRPTGCLH